MMKSKARQWTVYVTDITPAHTPKYWVVDYMLLDENFPHRSAKMLVPANDAMDVFYEFENIVAKWKPIEPFCGQNINVIWFQEEKV